MLSEVPNDRVITVIAFMAAGLVAGLYAVAIRKGIHKAYASIVANRLSSKVEDFLRETST